jgi:hypothetical protein
LLAARGEGRFTPALVKLAGDADPAVREAVADGLSDVIEYGEMRGRTLDDRLSRAMYDLMLACVLRTDHGAGVCFPPVLLQLDRARAAKALASDEALTIERNWLRWTLVALRDAGVVVGADKLRALLRDARAVLERADTPQSDRPGLGMLISELVLSIAQHDRDEAMTLASSLADSPHDAAREAAQNVREHLAEVDPVQRVIAEREAVGEIALMRPEHRNVYLVWLLDAEVQNGGWLQWVANSSGQHAPQTLEALRALGLDAAAGQLETMMAALGPRGWSDEQPERMAAIDQALSAAKTLPSDGDLWDMGTQIRAAISDYAERHREAFAADD